MNVAAVLSLFATLGFAPNVPLKTTRTSISAVEKSIDSHIQRLSLEDPYYLLGMTRGVYVSGFGVVFSTEVNLVANAAITPFRPKFTKEELIKLREKKQARAIELRQQMQNMLINAVWQMDTLPPDENVVLGISIYYFNWEDSAGLPRQIVMKANRKAIITTSRSDTAALNAAIHTEEY
jgi:hypothetical protein